MKSKFKLLTLSVSMLACGLGVSLNAHANAYALATNNIKDGFLVGLYDGTSIGTGIPGIFTFGTPSSLSSSSATLNGTGSSGSDVISPPDAPVSNGTGSFPVRPNELTFTTGAGNTYYKPYGQLGTSYSWGDAKVVSEQSITGIPIVARNAAETNIPVAGFGDADGRNASSTSLSLPVSVGKDCDTHSCIMDFSFKADPYIKVVLDALAAGKVARGVLATSITLSKVGGLIPIFAWAPDGAPGGIVGGTEVKDAENLNLTREVLFPGTSAEYSPAYGADIFGSFEAFTNPLGAGEYTLSLSMIEKTDAQRVPEPATLALMGIGLLGWGFVRRHKQA